jgi:alkylation response protein AidB-like acyl-CoA dehydrogenase
MSEEHRFNQVYFQDVVVPRDAVLGEINRGWVYARSTLETERSNVRGVVTIQQVLDEYTRAARERAGNGFTPWRSALVERHIEVQISRMMALRVVTLQASGKSPTHEASCNSLFSGELAQRVGVLGMQVFGMHGQAHPAFDSLSRAAKHFYLRSQSSTIRGGTKEIQRNVIAIRGLGLARE